MTGYKNSNGMKMLKITIITIFATLLLTGCKKQDTGKTMTLNVDTGDKIRIAAHQPGISSVSFDKEKNVITAVSNESDKSEKILVQGIFVPQNSYSLYYETAYTDTRCKISGSGTMNGAAYTCYTFHDNGNTKCEYIGWIIGSNTGVVFEGNFSDIDDFSKIMESISFYPEKTLQKNGNYVYIPDITEENNPDDMEHGQADPDIQENPTPDHTGTDHGISDWTSLLVMIDGIEYKFPYSYKQLQEHGWKLYGEISDYISNGTDGFSLSEGEYTYSTTRLVNEKYGDKLGNACLYVGYKNYGKEDKDILDCNIWAMEIAAVYGDAATPSIPDILLPGGIAFGASYEDIVSAYGKPDKEKEEENYKKLEYVHDYSQHIILLVYNNGGLLDVELQGYQ